MRLMGLALGLAWRDLRGGLRGLRVIVLCLALGVGAVSAVGSLRDAILSGMATQGSTLLGGDAEMGFAYRLAGTQERAFMQDIATRVSEIVEFRSMAVTGADQALAEVRAVDGAWPLYGEVVLDPPIPLAQALAGAEGLPGAVMDPVLMARLDLRPGDTFSLSEQAFRLTAALVREPDAAAAGLLLGPRIVVRHTDLARSGLLVPGALFEAKYRLALPAGADLRALRGMAVERFGKDGLRWRDRRNPAPGLRRFIGDLGGFLALAGLATLAVGGIGIAAATRAWLAGRVATIATLKALGAPMGLIFRIHLAQVVMAGAAGIVLGLVIGLAVFAAVMPLVAKVLPLAPAAGLSPRAMAGAVLTGGLVLLISALVPLARTERIPPAALYRALPAHLRLRGRRIVLLVALLAGLAGAVVTEADRPWLALGTVGAVALLLSVLGLAGAGLRRLCRRLSGGSLVRGRPGLRVALAALGAPGGETVTTVMALGLGLSVLATIGQIDSNLRAAILRDLPDRAPAFFFVDIQPDQLDAFREMLARQPGASDFVTAPMLRGTIIRIDGRPAREVAGDHWVLRGDRGVSYADSMPAGTVITSGAWWPEGYSGPPQASLSRVEAGEIGLDVGKTLTLRILGREITATVTSLREVDFASGGMGFVIILDAAALAGAPHGNIATLRAPPGSEAAILAETARRFPNISAISVRETAARLVEAMGLIAAAAGWAAAATLAAGMAVLIGTASAGEEARRREAAILKVLGASRRRILTSFALRAGLLGALAGLVAVLAGSLGARLALGLVMDLDYHLAPVPAVAIVGAGAAMTLATGLALAWRGLGQKPSAFLRAQD